MAEAEPVKSDIAKQEEEILKFWQENKIFEKSLQKEAPKGEFVFYDGPPFATGLPHYGHILASIIKDAIPRYQTMRGFHVPRRWGWDCHGLPIENLIEKELGLETKKDIEELGIEVFNEKARESVMRYADEWKKIIPRVGRWVDMENDYKTMDPAYTEKVWEIFKTLYDKGLVYEGYKSMHLCPRCETTLANFEVNQGYKDVTDISVTVKLELVDEPGTYLLAWTTTPWTLPGNVALAVGPEMSYVQIKWAGINTIVSENSKIKYPGEIVRKFSGKELVGKKYKPLFDYYAKDDNLKNRENGWQVYAADFVTAEDGTGIVHVAPAFGEDDLNLGQAKNLPFIQHVGADGKFKPEVTDFAGLPVKPKDDPQAADILVIKHLAKEGTLFAKEKIVHPYPHCWRCDTPLLNYAASSWFVAVSKIKDDLLRANQSITWIPEYIKEGRFGKWLEGARDWAVSRSRFWGAPLPVWRCEQCQKVEVVGSLTELATKRLSVNQFWLMRHGQAISNVKEILNATADPANHLTEVGKKQVEETASKLVSEKFDLLITSPVLRTQETARIVAEKLGLTADKIITDDRLREVGFGDLEGQSVAKFHAYFRDLPERFTKHTPNGENLQEVRARAVQALYEINANHQNKKILLITHEAIAWLLSAGALGLNSQEASALYQGRESFLETAEARPLEFKVLPHNKNFELDFHRPYIDEVKLTCECSGSMSRVTDVFDVWFESGSMPFAAADHFPADFIAEGLDQTRGWFYVTLVLAVALKNQSPFRRALVNGLILAEDGQKMSKRLKNYPEIVPTVDKYGADALRWYLLSSPAVHAEEFNFSERGLREVGSRVLGRLRNVLTFYQTYAGEIAGSGSSVNVLDRWIVSRLNQVLVEVTEALEQYELDRPLRALDLFIDDLSTWYVRRSRDRFKTGDEDARAAMMTTRFVLLELAKLMAPFTPFIADEIYRALKGGQESVHLENWPENKTADEKLIAEMAEVRRIVSLGLEARAKAGIKVRQPLGKLEVKNLKLEPALIGLIKDEVNVKTVAEDAGLETEVKLDPTITPELKEEGELRDLIREIQDWRKEQNLKPGEVVTVSVSATKRHLVEKFSDELKSATAAKDFNFVE